MYQYKEGLLPSSLTKSIEQITSAKIAKTRTQTSETTLSIKGLKKNDSMYEIINFWNLSNLEIKSRYYSMPSVKHRIKEYLRKRYNFDCDQENCFSCFATNYVALEEYAKK